MVGLALYYVPLYGDNPSLHLSPYYQGQRGFWNTHINQEKIPVPLMDCFVILPRYGLESARQDIWCRTWSASLALRYLHSNSHPCTLEPTKGAISSKQSALNSGRRADSNGVCKSIL